MSDASLAAQLQRIFDDEIPLTRAMALRVDQYDGQALALSAPLENNINDKATAFGGSLYSMCVLSGWGLLTLTLKSHELKGDIVIQDSQIQFLKPLRSARLAVRCAFAEPQQVDEFVSIYQQRGKARRELVAEILADGETAVRFTGRYVALKAD
ncbi:thioesterase domain-containing protein [Hahella aquimaris]|uniref:thioesterase domain-containing protein n=1 Tax=Hahella sp. HNIBRBA332 TaxID=3015983 RepID=UPI00273ACF5B|nr:thioesterase domain-containing protein [Hahella sp. HNIBRBA332]WLQ12106.1 thioesterase domain-containing protein [Hahella sp. HNIBRBA332]